MNKLNKIFIGGLTVLSLTPLNAINIYADEQFKEINNDNVTLDLPTIEKKYIITFEGITESYELQPGEIIPTPEYTGVVPEGKIFDKWNNDTYSVGMELPEITTGQTVNINFVPSFIDKPTEPVDPEPEPKPPVEVVITTKYITNVTSNNIIINQNEVQSTNLIELAQIKVDQTKEIYHDGILNSTEKVKPEITFKNTLSNELGIQVINFNVENSEEVYSLTVNVVANDNLISQDRSLTMSVDFPNVEITQEEAQTMKTAQNFINLNGVKGYNALGQQEQIGLVQSENVNLIASGKPGTYLVEYGILNQTTRNKFIATAEITVIATEKPVEEIPATNVDGTVNSEQLKDTTGNEIKNTKVEEKSNNKTHVVDTGINSNILYVFATSLIITSLYFLNKKRDR